MPQGPIVETNPSDAPVELGKPTPLKSKPGFLNRMAEMFDGDGPPVSSGPVPPGHVISSGPVPVPPGHVVSSGPAPDCCEGPDVCCDDCDNGCGWCPFWRRCGRCFDEPSTFWISGEYLLWFIKPSQFPALVSTGPPGTSNGVLGAPGTQVLFGGTVNNELRSGARISAGGWFDADKDLGLEGSLLFLAQRSVNFAARSAGGPGSMLLSRPFFNVVAGQEFVEQVAFPNLLAGGVAVNSTSRLWGAELNLRTRWFEGACWHMDVLGGFRYLELQEHLDITENLTVLGVPTGGSPGIVGSGISLLDQFRTRNDFYGGQIGTEFEFRRGRWGLGLLGKVALGDVREVIQVGGSTTFAVPGSPAVTQPGGLLALPTNSGNFSRNRFAVVPEAGVKVSYQVTPYLRLFVGYSFLAISDVARPGHQIDRFVNPTQLPSSLGPGTLMGGARPLPMPGSADFWAQGINFGLEWRY
jgi:hypothetical protein